jgi:hypothetical protein
MASKTTFFAGLTAIVLFCADAQAQHLWWDLEGQKDATCLYGQITILATHLLAAARQAYRG